MYLVSAYSATKRLIEPDLHTVYAIGFVSYKSPRFRSFSLEIEVCVRSQYTSQMYSIAKWFSAFVVVVALPSQIDVHFIRIIFPCVHFMRECHWFLRFIVFEMTHAQQSWSLRKIGRLFPMSPPPGLPLPLAFCHSTNLHNLNILRNSGIGWLLAWWLGRLNLARPPPRLPTCAQSDAKPETRWQPQIYMRTR